MKKLVFQVDIPGPEGFTLLSHNTPIYKHSKEKAQKYAKRVKADYLCLNDNRFVPEYAAHFQKFAIIDPYFSKYDMILWMDSDLIFYDHTPDLFVFAKDRDELFFANMEDHMSRITLLPNYFNSGLMLFKREMINQLSNWEEVYKVNKYFKSKLGEQHCFNKIVYDYHPDYFKLSRHFNSNGQTSRYYSIHFTGIGKKLYSPEKFEKWEQRALNIFNTLGDEEIYHSFFEWRPVAPLEKNRKKLF